jgi:indole-3-glycerol phosphate synthase
MVDDFLNKMAETKKAEIERMKAEVPLRLLKRSVREAPETRPLNLSKPFDGIGVIAEVKKASPSAGDIDPQLDPAALAGDYQDGGAAAISVLTEPTRFSGSVEDLVLVRSSVGLPVLRKDFIIDRYDLYRSRGLGADLVLLIAAMLPRDQLERLIDLTVELSMTPMLEIHSGEDLNKIKGLPAQLIGVNNRDLRTMTVNVETSFALIGQLLDCFPDCRPVSESGIAGPEVAARLAQAGYSAVLVGEYLVRSTNRRMAVADLVSASENQPLQSNASIQGNGI